MRRSWVWRGIGLVWTAIILTAACGATMIPGPGQAPERSAKPTGAQNNSEVGPGPVPDGAGSLAHDCLRYSAGTIAGSDCGRVVDEPALSAGQEEKLGDVLAPSRGNGTPSGGDGPSLVSQGWWIHAHPVDRLVPGTGDDGPGSVTQATVGTRRLFVDQNVQVMYVYEHGLLMREIPVSTGMLTSSTFTRAWEGQVGPYLGRVSSVDNMLIDQAWQLFRDVFGNIMIHSVPYVEEEGQRVYDHPEALGIRPTSHGCIRIALEEAYWLREWDPVGVPIEISGPPWHLQ